MTGQKRTPNEEATIEVDWLLQESYKRAVKLRGIVDWGALGTGTDRTDAERDVEKYQLEIAKLISDTLMEKQRVIYTKERNKIFDDEHERFEERMNKSDKKMSERYGDDDEKIGFRKGNDDNVDDRGTDDIGKP